MILRRTTPVKWREGYAVHRRKKRLDNLGEVQVWFDMEQPDVVVPDGDDNGVCWQEIGSWQENGRMVGGGRLERVGERVECTIQGALFGSLELALFDRLVIRGRVYELRRIQQWKSYRMLQLRGV